MKVAYSGLYLLNGKSAPYFSYKTENICRSCCLPPYIGISTLPGPTARALIVRDERRFSTSTCSPTPALASALPRDDTENEPERAVIITWSPRSIALGASRRSGVITVPAFTGRRIIMPETDSLRVSTPRRLALICTELTVTRSGVRRSPRARGRAAIRAGP